MNEKLDNYLDSIKGKKILIQGLGLNGGGVGTALFFLENGFNVTITDLKNSVTLKKSVDMLSVYEDGITYILGMHNEKDFIDADIVVKGPGVPPSNKYIRLAAENGAYITSDIEIFYKIAPCEIFAVTGSKVKSTVTSAVYNIFKTAGGNSFLGGNITISPLSFYRKLDEKSLVVLELSSWQLRDISGCGLNFRGAAITNLLNDHQNYYTGMGDYLDDKAIITQNQSADDFLILPYNDKYLNIKNIHTDAGIFYYSKDDDRADIFFKENYAVLKFGGKLERLFDAGSIRVPGEHSKINMLIAGAFSRLAGMNLKTVQDGVRTFTGVPYRMELVRIWNDIRFYNDTTATIPEASCNAIESFSEPVLWIAGGNDKNLDFSIIKNAAGIPKKIFLLKGEGTRKMKEYLGRTDYSESDSLEFLFDEAVKAAVPGDVILLSPGCTSFGLFQNEFQRGDVFNELVKKLK